MSREEDIITIRQGNSSVSIHHHGATVTSWKCDGLEMLFVSKDAIFNNKKAIRGGIPVVFPNFGPWELGPQHGFARITRWTLKESVSNESCGEAKAVFTLTDTEETRKIWNYNFCVTYTILLRNKEFETRLQVENSGSDEFEFTTLLHTYFSVPDINKTTISGLQGLQFIDKVCESQKFTEDRDQVAIKENYDRVYMSTPNMHVIKNAAGGHSVRMVKENFPDTVVWNPWIDKAKGMSDFGDEEYLNMLCVEPGHVSSPLTLTSGAVFEGKQLLSIIDSNL
ncbi:putative glucose-6-phosphate 1-epimerase [Anneissia japonica]|uniref:putative glucose-6-phosphate 1-epimerase n=1 Tax=Anneissia japonica TaxID=1529436 RepID=UPI0014259761|nr:putative glucose-6-phosphate 1-epimerase [Anneissia japonica]